MGLQFNQEPPIGDLNHNLTQLDLAKKPPHYRFEIVVPVGPGSSTLVGKVWDVTNRPFFDSSQGIIDRVDLAINPHTYKVTEPTREGITQTISGAWVDWYGLGLPKVSMAGTTGWNPKRFKGAPPPTNPYPLLDASRENITNRIKSLLGGTNPNAPSGLQDFIFLRNRIFRTYALLLQKLNLDFKQRIQSQIQLRFYAWDTEDYFIVLIDQFELNRSASRPMLYDYNIQMTVIGYQDARVDLDDFLNQYYNPKSRLEPVLGRIQQFVAYANDRKAAINAWVSIVAASVQLVAVALDELGVAIQDVLNGTQTFIGIPLQAVTLTANSLNDIGKSIILLENVPKNFLNDLHNQILETSCALNALKTYPSLFSQGFQDIYSQAPWANLTCSSSLGIPPSPTEAALGVSIPGTPAPLSSSPLSEVTTPNSPVSTGSKTQSRAHRIKEVNISEGDTLESVILKNGGLDQDVAMIWQQIATLNNLEYPYLAPDSNFQSEVYATVTVYFYGTPGTTIPTGTRVSTAQITEPGDSIVFKTNSIVTISPLGSVSVLATSEQPGEFANIKSLSIIQFLDSAGNIKTISGVNEMENPVAASGGKIYRVLRPGQKLKIPVLANTTVVEKTVDRSSDNNTNLFGNDLALDTDGDLVANSIGDVQEISGLKNVEAAVLDRVETDRGELIKHADYGMNIPRIVGEPGDQNHLTIAKIELTSTLLQDPRIKSVSRMSLIKLNDELNVDMNLVLIDEKNHPVGASLPV